MESVPTQETKPQNPDEALKELHDALKKDEEIKIEVPKYGLDEKSKEEKFSEFLTKSKPEDIHKSFQEGKYSYTDLTTGEKKADPAWLKYLSPDDWKKIHGVEEAKENEPKIEIVTPIGVEGRKISEETVQKTERFLEDLDKEKELREKQKEGKLLTSEELGVLKSSDMMRKMKLEKKKEEMKMVDEIIKDLTKDNIQEIKEKNYTEKSDDLEETINSALKKAHKVIEKERINTIIEKINRAKKNAIEIDESKSIRITINNLKNDLEKGKISFGEYENIYNKIKEKIGLIEFDNIGDFAYALKTINKVMSKEDISEILSHENSHMIEAEKSGVGRGIYQIQLIKDKDRLIVQPSVSFRFFKDINISDDERRKILKRIASAPDNLSPEDRNELDGIVESFDKDKIEKELDKLPEEKNNFAEKIKLYGDLKSYNETLKRYVDLSKLEDELNMKRIDDADKEKWDKERASIFFRTFNAANLLKEGMLSADFLVGKDTKERIANVCRYMNIKAEDLKANDKDSKDIILLKTIAAIKHRNYSKYRENEGKNIGDVAKWGKAISDLKDYYSKTFKDNPDFQKLFIDNFEELKEGLNQKEVEETLDKLPEKQREKISIGLNNLGFFVEEKKNRFFAKTFEFVSKGFDKKGTMGRFLTSLGENKTRDADKTRKLMEDMKEGKIKQLSNAGYVAGNVLKYGRTIADATGLSFASPLRYVMMGGMMFSTGAEAAKEARLKNEEVINKTRIKDIEQAENEAWKIYEEAQKKAGENEIKKEDLNKAYNENIPKDLMERLKKDPEPGVASNIIERIIKKDVERSVKNIDKKIEKIEVDKKLSVQEKEIEKEKIIKKYSEHLNSLDKMVSQYGTVDNLAMAAKYMETGSKTLVKGMMVETLILSVDKLFSSASEIFTHHEIINQPPPIEGVFESAVEVKSGDSVWKIVDRQLEGRGYFKDITGSPEEIMAKKTYIIDAIKDEIAKDPKSFGITSGDADKIMAGEKINFSSFFEKDAPNVKLGSIVEKAQGISKEDIASILSHKEMQEISQYETTEPEFSPEVEALRAQIDSWDNEMFGEVEHTDISIEQTQVDAQPELEPVHQEASPEALKVGITEQVVETISDKTTKATEDMKNFISSGNKGDWEKIKNMTYDQMSKNMPQFETRLNSIVAGNASKLGFDASIRDGEKIGVYVERIARSTV